MKKAVFAAIAAGLLLMGGVSSAQAQCYVRTCYTTCYRPCYTWCYRPVYVQPCYQPCYSWSWCW